MSYQVIARKWRPQAFEEVTGQEPITRTLRNAIEHERLHHAYLFSGARGVGKTTTARLLAKALNCHKSERPTPTPCRTTDPDQCPSCREIAEGRAIDVMEIDAASHTQVDNVRDVIINTIGIAPARDRFKVFIIDEVHMLSGHSFNALLKTIEEPPPRVVFIMATTHAHKIPVTILSRAQQFEFRTIAAPRIFERLRLIADAEQIQVSDDALREIARAGEGSMRDAQSAFDQVISFSTDAIEVGDVESALGIASAEMRARVMRAVAEEKPADALTVVEDLAMRGHDLRNFCRDLLAHVRDLLLVKVTGEQTETDDLAEAERRELARAGAAFAESDLVRFFHSLTETEKALRESAHPRYQLEIGLVKLIEMRRLAPLAQILERLSALEESLRTGKPPAANPGPASTPPASTPTTGGGSSSAPPHRTTTGGRSSSSSSSNAAPFSVAQDGSDAAKQEYATKQEQTANSIPNDADTPPFEPPPRRAETTPARAESTQRIAPQTSRDEPPPRVEQPPARVEATPRVKSPATTPVETPASTRPAPPSIPGLPKRPVPSLPSLPASVSASPPSQASGLKLVPPSAGEAHNAPTVEDWRATSSDARSASAAVRAPSSFFDDAPDENQDGQSDWFRADDPQGKHHAAPPLENHNTGAFTYVNGATQTPRPPVAPTPPVAAAPARAAQPTNDTLEQLKKLLDERRKPLLISALEGARRAILEGDELYVEYAPEGKHLRDALSKPDNIKILRDVCREATGREMGVRIVVKEAGAGDDSQLTQEDEARQEKQKLREIAERDPFVQKVLRTFRAEIIDVRRVEPDDAEANPPRPL